MPLRSNLAKASLTAASAVMALSALAVPTFAAAQDGYDNRGGYYYDPCKRDTTGRATTGGVIGALAGAAIGSNLAAHHGGRTGGAALGAAAGALAGATIGKNSAACNSNGAPPPPRQGYYNNGGGSYYGSNSYDNGYYNREYDRSRYDDRSAYDRYGNSYPVAERPADASGCTLAESPIYLPDGRVQKRFVRVCQDSNGRYQVVD